MPTLYPGILVSTRRNFESNTLSELHYALTKELKINTENIFLKNTGISGLVTVKLENVDIFQIMRELIALEKDAPYFIHSLKFRPIEFVTGAEITNLEEYVEKNRERITGEYKIEVNKRHAKLKSMEIINAVAPGIENKVNLDNPESIVSVEILGDKMGLGIITPDLIYSTHHKQTEEASDDNWFLS